MPRRWHHLISALLLVVLSGTPALAAVCLGWCDDPFGHAAHGGTASIAPTDEVEAAHHGPAHHDAAGHDAEATAGSPSDPEAPLPCHGAPASAGARLGAALVVVACDAALGAVEATARSGGLRANDAPAPPSVAFIAAQNLQRFSPDRARPLALTAAAFHAPLVLRI